MKNILVVGGAGALGRAVIHTFKQTPKWNTFNIDINENKDADFFYKLEHNMNEIDLKNIHKSDFFKTNRLDCVVNVAGGWLGGGIENDNVIESVDKMMKLNLYSSILSANIAKQHLNKSALFVLTGANAVKEGLNPGMIAYHLSKQSVHHFAELLSNTQEMPENSKIITILPSTIDTQANRNAMPDADFTKWTKPELIAEKIKKWADSQQYPTESFVKF